MHSHHSSSRTRTPTPSMHTTKGMVLTCSFWFCRSCSVSFRYHHATKLNHRSCVQLSCPGTPRTVGCRYFQFVVDVFECWCVEIILIKDDVDYSRKWVTSRAGALEEMREKTKEQSLTQLTTTTLITHNNLFNSLPTSIVMARKAICKLNILYGAIKFKWNHFQSQSIGWHHYWAKRVATWLHATFMSQLAKDNTPNRYWMY